MKALSLIQPWAWLVTVGPKRIENRTWHLPASMVGQVILIHASKTDPRRYAVNAAAMLREIDPSRQLPPEAFEQRGGIVGWARLAGCLCPGHKPPPGVDARWWMPDQHGFLLDRIGVVPFVPLRGSMGFFEVPKGLDVDLFEPIALRAAEHQLSLAMANDARGSRS